MHYSGDQGIRVKSLQDTKCYFGLLMAQSVHVKRMLSKFAWLTAVI